MKVHYHMLQNDGKIREIPVDFEARHIYLVVNEVEYDLWEVSGDGSFDVFPNSGDWNHPQEKALLVEPHSHNHIRIYTKK